MVCLITGTAYIGDQGGEILGAAGFVPTPGGGFTGNAGAPVFYLAFMLVEANAISANFTFSHEFGHVLGCRPQTCELFFNGGCDSREALSTVMVGVKGNLFYVVGEIIAP